MEANKPRKKCKVAGDKSEIVAIVPKACADEATAVDFIERQRWGDCPCCPRCGDTNVRKMLDAQGNRNARFLWRCLGCKKQYTVRIGTVYEESRIPLRHWCYAMWASVASKKGVSALQIKRQTGLNYRSALFLLNRIRYAMSSGPTPPKLTGTVEADETYVGGKPRHPRKGIVGRNPFVVKTPVFAAVERGGRVRCRVMPDVNARNVKRVLREIVSTDAHLRTDESSLYIAAGRPFASHKSTKHSMRQYVDKNDPTNHSNTVEGFFSLLKRGLVGTFHSVSRKHLHRYLSEFEFRYDHRKIDDGARLAALVKGANHKRLTYADNVAPEGPATAA
jgi:transposase-like protein